jgi:hypothetical protein
MVVSGTARDSHRRPDLPPGGRPRPEIIVSDAGAYSDIVFGLLNLLDIEYRPEPVDLPDNKLWHIDAEADYGPLATAARGRIDLAKINAHWPDILRIVGSIHTGAVSAHDVIRMLSRDGVSPGPLWADLQGAARPLLCGRGALPLGSLA